MASRMGLIGCLVIVVALLKCATAQTQIASVEYEVGDSLGWAVPPNTSYYSTWASTKTFYLGDSFYFNWPWTGNQNVVPVPKPYYDNCTSGGIIIASPVIYTPPSTGTYYFICIVGDHCERGQKVAITILPAIGSPKSSDSSLTVGAFFAMLATTAVISFLHLV
ncbi:Cucumber peeling cupredoxin [Morella rubra]|uniref:Cucumber peeling cupredoxin n=1 Tax=Morella rubra TaxID=262757 RepID=A0A6A1UGV9_9ROSI|nr:Cucumber peeling cupredoxin [Morella rubra]